MDQNQEGTRVFFEDRIRASRAQGVVADKNVRNERTIDELDVAGYARLLLKVGDNRPRIAVDVSMSPTGHHVIHSISIPPTIHSIDDTISACQEIIKFCNELRESMPMRDVATSGAQA